MKPTRTLPEHYALVWELDIKNGTRLNIILQIAGLGWMLLAGVLLTGCVTWIRPNLWQAFAVAGGLPALAVLGLLLLNMIITISLHELVHGLFFWLFSKHPVQFGLGPGYAYAGMPGWFFPRDLYLVIGLAPLILLSGLGLIACAFIPLSWLAALLTGMIINAGGAIGDMYVCMRICREDPQVLIKDTGDGFQVYRQKNTQDGSTGL
jgi:hypothetical protein